MRKYFLVILLGFLTLTYLSCDYFDRSTANALRIVDINNSEPLVVDAKDWYLYVDPEDPEETLSAYAVKDWIIPVSVSYTETGIGLPTYPTNYTARITSYKVNFDQTRVLIDGIYVNWKPTSVTGATNMVVPSNPSGQTEVTADINVLPKEWIEARIDTLELGCLMTAKIILSGVEELNGNPVEDTGAFTIDFGDYYDDPRFLNQ
jgi:hypothetical protein